MTLEINYKGHQWQTEAGCGGKKGGDIRSSRVPKRKVWLAGRVEVWYAGEVVEGGEEWDGCNVGGVVVVE